MLTNVKRVQPTVLVMRTVQTQRAHIIVVVKLDLQEMEPIAPVEGSLSIPCLLCLKNKGTTEREGHYFSDQNLQIVVCLI